MVGKIIYDKNLMKRPSLKGWDLTEYSVEELTIDHSLALGDTDRAVYFLSLSSGGLRYQIDFIKENKGVGQWFIAAFDGNSRTVTRLKDILGDVDSPLEIIQMKGDGMEKLKNAIESHPVIRRKTCLIYSKRPYTGKKTLAALLVEKCLGWQFPTAEGDEAVLEQESRDVEKLIVMGRSLQDFSLAHPAVWDGTVILWYNRMDQDLQRCRDEKSLWQGIRQVMELRDWILPEKYPHFYTGSALYESWRTAVRLDETYVNTLLVDERFVMWDDYGLPQVRSEYAPAAAARFLEALCSADRLSESFV